MINEQFYKYNFGGDYLLVNLVMNTMKVNQVMSQMVILRRNLIQMKITIGVIALILTKNMTGVKNMIMMRKHHLIVMLIIIMMRRPHLIIMTMMIKMMIQTIIITQIKEGAEL